MKIMPPANSQIIKEIKKKNFVSIANKKKIQINNL